MPLGDDLPSSLRSDFLGGAPIGQQATYDLVLFALVAEVEDLRSAPPVDRVAPIAPRFALPDLASSSS